MPYAKAGKTICSELVVPINRWGVHMNFAKRAAFAAILIFVANGAQAVESSVRVTTKASVAAVWQKIGDFCGIAAWGGGIAHCELSTDHKRRTLTLKDGATVVEELVRWNATRHS